MPKMMPFIISNWNAKIRSQVISGVTNKFGLGVQNEAGLKLTEFFFKRTHWSQQTLFSNNTRDSTYEYHQMINTEIRLIIFFAVEYGEALYNQKKKKRTGVDCNLDHVILIEKFRLKLEKVWNITRPLRYYLNQSPYNFTVEITSVFKGLDLVDRANHLLSV